MSKILVTGGAGFIGGHVCKALALQGYEPIVIDNLSTGHKHNVKWGALYQVDLRDSERLNQVFRKHNFEAVVHLAASAYVGESQKVPIKYFENNVSSTINLLKYMYAYKVNSLVFSSSCAVYGHTKNGVLIESSEKSPVSNYGLSKLFCEQIIESTSRAHKFHYAILRYFNASGADSDNEIIEEHEPETHVIPRLLKSAMDNRVFEIYGKGFNTPDGTAVRDYVHVSDLADAHTKALHRVMNQNQDLVLNLGTGRGYSVLELIEGIRKLGLKINVEFSQARSGDPDSLVANSDSAFKLLNWQPNQSSLENILLTSMNSLQYERRS